MATVKALFRRIRYSSFLVFHPFKGFWDLKHEGIGTVSVASLYVLILALTQVVTTQFSGFIVNYTDTLKTNIFYVMIRTVAIFMVWVLANWSITTLMDGEGKIRDIYITTAYALVPYIVSRWIAVLLSNFIVAEEATFYYLISAIGLLWSGLLLLAGLMTVHQFSFGKTVATVLIAVLAMIIILFLVLMLVTLLQQMINFALLIYQEATQ